MLIILIKLQTKMASERGTYMVSKWHNCHV
jgi:hypothetical protein